MDSVKPPPPHARDWLFVKTGNTEEFITLTDGSIITRRQAELALLMLQFSWRDIKETAIRCSL